MFWMWFSRVSTCCHLCLLSLQVRMATLVLVFAWSRFWKSSCSHSCLMDRWVVCVSASGENIAVGGLGDSNNGLCFSHGTIGVGVDDENISLSFVFYPDIVFTILNCIFLVVILDWLGDFWVVAFSGLILVVLCWVWQGCSLNASGYRNFSRYSLHWSGWYYNPTQHKLCRPRRPAQRVLWWIAVQTTTAHTI